ncbi:MauE/DoxX family redox-associated membrane protein [Streptosporangium sp. NPDC051022]|uniref:MauE/DoxX family redox-associated membrane protein n=1 Tax=Streptosporangium sp. NPDC051022 TaxID=3155752 RepID=UPI00342A3ED9
MAYVFFGITCFLATTFALAFFTKVRSLESFLRFEQSIGHLAVLPPRAGRPAAMAIVVCEGATVLLLALPVTRGFGFLLASVLLVVFIGVAVRAVRKGVIAECRCFGRKGSIMSTAMIIRNAIMIALAATGSLLSADGASRSMAYTICAAALGTLTAVLYVRYYDDAVRAIAKRLPATAELS